jgi:hypothetical protein
MSDGVTRAIRKEIYHSRDEQLADVGCIELATSYHKIAKDLPRDNH